MQSKWNPVCSSANSPNEIQRVPVQTVKIKSILREHLAVTDNAKCKTYTAAGQGVISILLKFSSQSQPASRHSHCKCDTWPPFFATMQSASINLNGNSCEGFFSRCMHPLYTHTHTHITSTLFTLWVFPCTAPKTKEWGRAPATVLHDDDASDLFVEFHQRLCATKDM